jgi:hypothetical protein
MTKTSRINAETHRLIGIWDIEAHETVQVKGSPDEQYGPNGAGDAAAAKRYV